MACCEQVAITRFGTAGASLPILHVVHDVLGHIPGDVVPEIAHALNLSRAEVHDVVTYYQHFRAEPADCCLVQVCLAEAIERHRNVLD